MPMLFVRTHSSRSPPDWGLMEQDVRPDHGGQLRPRMESSLISAPAEPTCDSALASD